MNNIIYKDDSLVKEDAQMYELPILLIDKNLLVPLPSNNYYLTIQSNNFVETETFIAPGENYENAFVFGIMDNENVLEFGLICQILDQQLSQGNIEMSFIALRKVERLTLKDGGKCEFVLSKTVLKKEDRIFLRSFLELASLNPELKIALDETSSVFSESIGLQTSMYHMDPDKDLSIRFLKTTSWQERICIAFTALNNFNKQSNYKFVESKNGNDAKKSIYPKNVAEKIENEKKRLKNIPQSSQEHSATQDYLEVIQSIPWQTINEESINVAQIKEDLNKSHFGLETIKDEVLDYYALKELTGVTASSCLLFSGPPGTGKTTIAKSIAKSTGRDFIVIAVGGISDESEFRGHRRTYTGSKPGRLVSALTKCKSSNPIILLDEIDKISSMNKGDPYGALLEILDPEQNKAFVDRYLEEPIDLSKCMFICTANDIKNIPEPVLDRLDNITFYDYSVDEKVKIINDYIFDKVKTNYNMKDYDFKLHSELIEHLSREYDLRKITREIERISRKIAAKILSKQEVKEVTVDDYNNMYKESDTEKETIKSKTKRRIGFGI